MVIRSAFVAELIEKKMNHVNLVKAYINKRGVTQLEFSKRSGIPQNTVNSLLRGRLKSLSKENEKRLVDFLESGK